MRRQMRRAQLAAMHNKRVMDAGTGDVWDVRTTDVNEALCRRRYQARAMPPGAGACTDRLCTGTLEGTGVETFRSALVSLSPRATMLKPAPARGARTCPNLAGVQGSLPHHPAPQVFFPLLFDRRHGHARGGAAADHARAAVPVVPGPGRGDVCSDTVRRAPVALLLLRTPASSGSSPPLHDALWARPAVRGAGQRTTAPRAIPGRTCKQPAVCPAESPVAGAAPAVGCHPLSPCSSSPSPVGCAGTCRWRATLCAWHGSASSSGWTRTASATASCSATLSSEARQGAWRGGQESFAAAAMHSLPCPGLLPAPCQRALDAWLRAEQLGGGGALGQGAR